MNEFDLIKQFFDCQIVQRPEIICGIGDDAALIEMPKNKILVTSTDTLVSGIHFLENTSAENIAYKSLAVNLSDFAAMGAEPAWFLLSLTLPDADPIWLENFSKGLFELAQQFNCQCIGGDTTRGPLSITITLLGTIPNNAALLRSGANVGDHIYVSGTLGDAGVGLAIALGKIQLPQENYFRDRLNRPIPRITLGKGLRTIASSAIDISDGLLADLGHILVCSQVGAMLHLDQLPLSAPLLKSISLQDAHRYALTSGDDYELCFTVPLHDESRLLSTLKKIEVPCTRIGEIVSGSGINISGSTAILAPGGYQHFR